MPWSGSRGCLSLLACVAGAGCQPEAGQRRASPLPEPSLVDSADTGASDDTDSQPPAAGCRIVDVQPRTIPDEAEGTVRWLFSCEVLALGSSGWAVDWGDDPLLLQSEIREGLLSLTALVPAGALGPGRHDLGPAAVGGEPLDDVRLSLRVHATEEAVATALRGTGWNAWAGPPQESRSFYLGDPDGNRVLDLLSTAVLADGTVVQHAQQADGEGAFQDRRGLAHVEADGFVSGEGFWFESDTEGVLSLVAATEPGEVAHVRKSTFVDRDWTETVLRVNHGFMGERVPDVLLAAEPEWAAPGELLMKLLGVVDRGSGPVGLYCEGSVCREWARIGGLTPAELMAGQGFLGSFVDGELGALQPANSQTAFWSLDARNPRSGLPLQVLAYDYHSESWSPARSVSLPDPGFVVQAVSAAGQDLGGDGHLDLVVELWGEGGWQAWLLRGVDDKEEARPALLLGAAAERMLWASPAPAAAGATVLVPSTFVANGRVLRSTRLVADAPVVDGATAALVVVEEWSLPDELDGAGVSASPSRGAVVGRVELDTAEACTDLAGGPLPACRRGMLPQSVAAAGTEGAADPLGPYRDGDVLVLGPGEGQDRVLVSRGLHPEGVSPGWLAAAAAEGDGAVRVGWSAGLRLVAQGEDHGALCHSQVQVLSHPDGRVITGQTPVDCAEGTSSVWWPDGSTQRIWVPEGDAVRGVTLLSSSPSPDGTWPATWRTEAGQAWLGALVLTPGSAPEWLGDPQQLGDGGARVVLSLDAARPGAVVLESGPDNDWPPALVPEEVSGEPLPFPLEDGVVVSVVAAPESQCPWQTAVLPRPDAESGPVALFEAEDLDCRDLLVPVAAGRIDGSGEALVSASAAGRLVVTRFRGTQVAHQDVATGLTQEDVARARVSVGDLNGDGLDDLLLSRLDGAPASVFLSDGSGGWLPAEALATQGGGRNAVGLAAPAPGRPAPTSDWVGTLPTLQRALVPVASP